MFVEAPTRPVKSSTRAWRSLSIMPCGARREKKNCGHSVCWHAYRLQCRCANEVRCCAVIRGHWILQCMLGGFEQLLEITEQRLEVGHALNQYALCLPFVVVGAGLIVCTLLQARRPSA